MNPASFTARASADASTAFARSASAERSAVEHRGVHQIDGNLRVLPASPTAAAISARSSSNFSCSATRLSLPKRGNILNAVCVPKTRWPTLWKESNCDVCVSNSSTPVAPCLRYWLVDDRDQPLQCRTAARTRARLAIAIPPAEHTPNAARLFRSYLTAQCFNLGKPWRAIRVGHRCMGEIDHGGPASLAGPRHCFPNPCELARNANRAPRNVSSSTRWISAASPPASVKIPAASSSSTSRKSHPANRLSSKSDFTSLAQQRGRACHYYSLRVSIRQT